MTAKPLAPCLMVVGTGSSVGKSLIVAGLCRYFHLRGIKAAPFKSQNMALNSFVTLSGKEIGTAQAMQAAAAGIEPTVAMNPILLKPEGQRRSQVIVSGEAVGSMAAVDYHRYKPQLKEVVAAALVELRQRYEVVVIEGAGSPVEMNLKSHDIVNMFVAELAEARVIIAGDIDKGGIFAALIGTYDLLSPTERQLVAGFVINKFRGDPALLGDGLGFIEQKTGVPVLGVLPMMAGLTLPDEDGHLLHERMAASKATPTEPATTAAKLDIGIVSWPRMSNFDEFAQLRHSPGIAVRLIETPAEVMACHLVILPGSKQTAADLGWLRERGLDAAISRRFSAGLPIFAICGGFQMLGTELVDKLGMESSTPVTTSLGLLPFTTHFQANKTLRRVRWRVAEPARAASGGLLAGLTGEYDGYEIHCGTIRALASAPASASTIAPTHEPKPYCPLVVTPSEEASPQQPPEILAQVAGTQQNLFGTLVHGVLNHPEAIACLSANLRRWYFLPATLPAPSEHEGSTSCVKGYEDSYDAVAAALDDHLDMTRLTAELFGAQRSE